MQTQTQMWFPSLSLLILLNFLIFFSQSVHTVQLFMDPQISLFSNFFIKNWSHGTIHTFKNYFVTVFFSFQFSAVSKRTLSFLFLEIFSRELKKLPLFFNSRNFFFQKWKLICALRTLVKSLYIIYQVSYIFL